MEGIIYRYRTGVPLRDLPGSEFGPWQTVWKRHRRYAGDGTWDRVLMNLLATADAVEKLDWTPRPTVLISTLATRYDKLAIVHRAAAVLSACIT